MDYLDHLLLSEVSDTQPLREFSWSSAALVSGQGYRGQPGSGQGPVGPGSGDDLVRASSGGAGSQSEKPGCPAVAGSL